MSGFVYLVGAGPGDPGLLTLRGRDILGTADLIVYDRLVHPSLLDHARPDAERIYVGKQSSRHTMKQDEINSLLVEQATAGKSVCRLKGGDPFVFGRGGEEAEACAVAGIQFEVVPGVTSAIAAAAYAGIPVTHRDLASSFAVITGHERADSDCGSAAEQRRDWAGIAKGADTLVFLMGVESLSEIAARLIENGRSPETPVGVVEWGTWPRQRSIVSTLASVAEDVRRAGITAPAVTIVGEVVRLRETLRWFDRRPLFGKRILVTRAREQASDLSNLLAGLGAEPVEFPVIRIEEPADQSGVDSALITLIDYDYLWVVFTSANAVRAVFRRLDLIKKDARAFGSVGVAAIGPATADALRQRGIEADFIPTRYVAESVLEEWPDREMAGKRVLIPRAEEARDVLPDGLRAMGARVDVLPVYRTVMDAEQAESIRGELISGSINAVTFTSSSTVRNFVAAIGEETARTLSGQVLVASIGPITSETARESGLPPDIEAEEHTIPGLVDSVVRYFASGS